MVRRVGIFLGIFLGAFLGIFLGTSVIHWICPGTFDLGGERHGPLLTARRRYSPSDSSIGLLVSEGRPTRRGFEVTPGTFLTSHLELLFPGFTRRHKLSTLVSGLKPFPLFSHCLPGSPYQLDLGTLCFWAAYFSHQDGDTHHDRRDKISLRSPYTLTSIFLTFHISWLVQLGNSRLEGAPYDQKSPFCTLLILELQRVFLGAAGGVGEDLLETSPLQTDSYDIPKISLSHEPGKYFLPFAMTLRSKKKRKRWREHLNPSSLVF